MTERIIQKETDQTAAIVYRTALDAVESGNDIFQASLIHEEDPHINLGRTQEWIPDIKDDLQFRRWGGGGYIVHDNTYCFIDSRSKLGPKEGTSMQRDRMAHKTLEALSEVYDEVGVADGLNFVLDSKGNEVSGPGTVYYEPGEGDIYIQKHSMPRSNDPQIAGIGLAELEIDDEWVQIGRVCIYPEKVSQEAEELDRRARKDLTEYEDELNKRIHPVESLDTVIEALESGENSSIQAEEYITDEAQQNADRLNKELGYRSADPCF